jgi:sugar lactone lactonase YvrE
MKQGIFIIFSFTLFVACSKSDYKAPNMMKPAANAQDSGNHPFNILTVAGGNGAGAGADQLYLPVDVAVDDSGNVYVADAGNNRIQKWGPGAKSGITVAGGNGIGSAANQLNQPIRVVVDGNGYIYISDAGNSRIQKWAPGAEEGVTILDGHQPIGGGKIQSASNQFAYPSGLVIDKNDNIFLTDYGNNRIQKWTTDASFGITVAGDSTGFAGSDENKLYGPGGIALDSNGQLFVADILNNRIQKWVTGSPTGATVAGSSIGDSGTGDKQLNRPYAVFIDRKGNLFVADGNNNRIQKWTAGDSTGRTVAGGGDPGSAPGQLNTPTGVFVDNNGRIFIADRNNNRIQEWR